MARRIVSTARTLAFVLLGVVLRASAEQAPAPAQPSCVQARDLMTPAEVAEHREKMRSLQSDAERAAFRRANHEEMKKRAAERGTVLCDEQGILPPTGSGAPSSSPSPSK